MERYLKQQVFDDLKRKMVFIGGPRQVGKTTFSRQLYPAKQVSYYNWDISEHQSLILAKEFTSSRLLIFDEIHKFRKWRNYLKGLYDGIKAGSFADREILVTGSARLDLYRFGGDSLQGRYHYLRLMPLSFAEIRGKTLKDLETLLHLTGFPEPFLGQSEDQARRWSREYRVRLVREDLRDLEAVKEVDSILLLINRLPDCIGSPLSIESLRGDLSAAHKTVSRWLDILERIYGMFRLLPMGGPKIRSVKKERKAYLFDWSTIKEVGPKFENLVAVHLLKYVYWNEDKSGRDLELRYFRDTDGREVDFVVTENSKPILFVECKASEGEISPHLKYLAAKYPKVPAYQIYLHGHKDFQTPQGIRHCPATVFLKDLV